MSTRKLVAAADRSTVGVALGLRTGLAVVVVFLLLGLSVAVGSFGPDAGAAKAAVACPDVAVYGVRGSGEPYLQSELGMGPTVSTVDSDLLHLLPSSLSILSVGVPYPARGPAWALLNGAGKGPYNDSVLTGAELLVNGSSTFEGLHQLVARCPRVDVVLIGLSQGAQVITEALTPATRSQTVTDRIVAIVLYGNPVRKPGAVYDVGTNASRGILAAPGLQPGGVAASIPSFLWPSLRSYCLAHDPICAFTAYDFSHNLSIHSTYGSSAYATAGAGFAASQILALQPSPPISTVRPIHVTWAGVNTSSVGWLTWTIETAKPFATDDAPCLHLVSVTVPGLAWIACGTAASGFAFGTVAPLRVGGGYAGKADVRRPDPTTIIYRIPRSIFTHMQTHALTWQTEVLGTPVAGNQPTLDTYPATPRTIHT